MRYQIIKHKIRRRLLFILTITLFAWLSMWAYRNIFVYEDDFIVQDDMSESYDFSYYPIDIDEIQKGVSFDLKFLDNDYLFSQLSINEMDFKGMVFSGLFFVKLKIVRDEEANPIRITGKLFSKSVSLNSKLNLPARMSFEISKDAFVVQSLRLAKSYELKGKVGLGAPFETDLKLTITRADIRDLARLANVKNLDRVFGVINGIFYIKGKGVDLFSNGTLESRNGKVGSVDYDLAIVRCEGFGPIINILDSGVKHGNGTIKIGGYIDLRKIAKSNLVGDLNFKSDMKEVAWGGWDITKKGTDELRMTKNISDDKMRIGFKAKAGSPVTTYYNRDDAEELSLEYRLGVEDFKMELKENEEFFGVEHSVKF